MAKSEAVVAIVVFIFAMSFTLGFSSRIVATSLKYNPDLGFAAEGPINKDIDLIINGTTLGKINSTIEEERKKAGWCLQKLRQHDLGDKCINAVEQALRHGHRTVEELNLPCCHNVVDLDKEDDICWDILFGGDEEIEIDTLGLIEFCEQEVLKEGPTLKV